jgi:hypothetical protein
MDNGFSVRYFFPTDPKCGFGVFSVALSVPYASLVLFHLSDIVFKKLSFSDNLKAGMAEDFCRIEGSASHC